MKVFFLFILFWSFGYNLCAQNKELIPAKYEMEILKKNGDTTFVKVSSIKGKKLVSEQSFYLIPEKIKQPRYFRLPLFNTEIRLPFFDKKSYYVWIRKHGLFNLFLDGGRSILTEYSNDEFKHQTLFYHNSEITQDDYFKMEKGPFYVRGVHSVLPRLPYEIVYDGKNYSIKNDNQGVLNQPAQ